MRWQEYIAADPDVVAGKPVVRGTRLSVEFLLRLLASDRTREQVRQEHPHPPAEGLTAALLFAAEAVQQERVARPTRPRNTLLAAWLVNATLLGCNSISEQQS